MVIGITGGSGCGKSTVAHQLEKDGFYVIDADIVARKCVEQGKGAYLEIKEYFGDDMFLENGELNRKKLGSIVFSDEEKLNALNSITHKYILSDVQNEIKENTGRDIIIDAAVLKKGGLAELCDVIIHMRADKDVRIKRILARDAMSYKDALNRVESQESDEQYGEHCDFAVDNSGVDNIETVAKKIICFIESRRNQN